MIRTKEQVITELKKMVANSDDIAKKIYDVLVNDMQGEDLKAALIELWTNIISWVKERGATEQEKELLESYDDKESIQQMIVSRMAADVKKYLSMIADCLSVYRSDEKCMEICIQTYLAYDVNDDGLAAFEEGVYCNAQENLGLLYADKNCSYYNVQQAYLCLSIAGGEDSKKAEVLYAYAKCLESLDNVFMKLKAFPTYKKAADLGYAEAKQEYEKICRSKKLCTNCGGQFKGFLVKKCSKCGKKKTY